MIDIVRRALALGLPEDHPLAVFTSDGTTTGEIEFINSDHIAEKLQDAARAVYEITDPEEIARYTSHSIRIGACVALHTTGLCEMDIKHALRWCSNTFWNYRICATCHDRHSELQSQ
jgi:hypothetical protein